MSKIALSFSGGMDSSVLLFWAASISTDVYALTFNYNQRHRKELNAANRVVQDCREKYPHVNIEHKVIDVSFIRDLAPTSSLTNDDIETPDVHSVRGEAQPLSYVPNRNMMFLSILASYGEANQVDKLWYGAALADSFAGYWDGSEEFLEAINNVIKLNRERTKIIIEAPLLELDKGDIVKRGVELGVKFKNTWTCYAGEDLADANTASSSLRLQGFIDAGFRDPIKYKQQKYLDELYDANGCVEC